VRTRKQANEDLIESFCIPGQDGYSEYWRRDKSPIESLELAKLLLSIRKIASYVGRNTGDIVWAGMECQDGISLDPSFIMGSYPVPAGRTDIVVGLAIQKAYQKTEWSERFQKIALERLSLMPVYAYKFKLFFDIYSFALSYDSDRLVKRRVSNFELLWCSLGSREIPGMK